MLPGHLAAGMTVLERQQAQLRWQGQTIVSLRPLDAASQLVKPDPGTGNGWPEMAGLDTPGPGVGNPNAVPARQGSFKKRKLDKMHSTKANDENKDKKMRGSPADEEESKITQQSNNTGKGGKRETSACSSKENSKASEAQKTDYIHVRARRGQATDSHSLAERARREKISERMKYLQDLVPGCNKITGKAGMLDEIINYVQSLQRQVEFLSMKLSTVNPIDLNIDNLFSKEAFVTSATSIPTIDVSPEINNHLAYLQSNPMQQALSCLGLELGISSSTGLQASVNAPLPIPETFFDSSIFNQILPSGIWETDLQNLYNYVDCFQQGRATSSLASQQWTGSVEVSNLKMEM